MSQRAGNSSSSLSEIAIHNGAPDQVVVVMADTSNIRSSSNSSSRSSSSSSSNSNNDAVVAQVKQGSVGVSMDEGRMSALSDIGNAQRQQSRGIKSRAKSLKRWSLRMLIRHQSMALTIVAAVLLALMGFAVDNLIDFLLYFKQGICWPRPWLSYHMCCRAFDQLASCGDGQDQRWIQWPQLIFGHDAIHPESPYYVAGFFVGYAIFALMAIVLILITALLTKHFAPQAAGSGIPELKVLLSGNKVRGLVTGNVFVIKIVGVVLAISANLTFGKEAPFAHISCALGNMLSNIKFLPRTKQFAAKRRELISACSAIGLSIAFNAPIGGVLYAMEEICLHFSHGLLFKSFVGAMLSVVILRLLSPFQFVGQISNAFLRAEYISSWHWFEVPVFILLGIWNGFLGSVFLKLNFLLGRMRWSTRLKRLPIIESLAIIFITTVVIYWNPFTRASMVDTLHELFLNQCHPNDAIEPRFRLLCSTINSDNAWTLGMLAIAGVSFFFLFTITFGMRVPNGTFVPALLIGAIWGTVAAVLMRQVHWWLGNDFFYFAECRGIDPAYCISPAMYSLVSAAAFLTGATRVTIALVVILVEMTTRVQYIFPISCGVLVARWAANLWDSDTVYEVYINMKKYPVLSHGHDLNDKLHLNASDVVGFISSDLDRNDTEGSGRARDIGKLYAEGISVTEVKNMLSLGAHARQEMFPIVRSESDYHVVGLITRSNLEKAFKENSTILKGEECQKCDNIICFDRLLQAAHRNALGEEDADIYDTDGQYVVEPLQDGAMSLDLSNRVDTGVLMISDRTSIYRIHDLFFSSVETRYCMIVRSGVLRGMITRNDYIGVLRAWHMKKKDNKVNRLVDRAFDSRLLQGRHQRRSHRDYEMAEIVATIQDGSSNGGEGNHVEDGIHVSMNDHGQEEGNKDEYRS